MTNWMLQSTVIAHTFFKLTTFLVVALPRFLHIINAAWIVRAMVRQAVRRWSHVNTVVDMDK